MPESTSLVDEEEGDANLGGFGSPSMLHRHADHSFVAADAAVAAMMSEQQAIITSLRGFRRSPRPRSEILESLDFQALVARLSSSQQSLKQLLSDGTSAGAPELRLLVRQSKQMLELLSEVAEGGGGGADCQNDDSPRRSNGLQHNHSEGSNGYLASAECSISLSTESSIEQPLERVEFPGYAPNFDPLSHPPAKESSLSQSLPQPPPPLNSSVHSLHSTSGSERHSPVPMVPQRLPKPDPSSTPMLIDFAAD